MRWSGAAARAIAVGLLASGGLTGPAQAARMVVGGSADTVAVAPGQAFVLELVARQAGPAFNAFDLDVKFDPARLTNQTLSPLSSQRGTLMTGACVTNSPFHVFSASPDSLMCTLVILCAGVSVTGPGQLYRVGFTAALGDAWTQVSFGPATRFFLGGPQVDTVEMRPIVIKIGDPPVLDAAPPSGAVRLALEPLVPNPARTGSSLRFWFALPRADAVSWALLDAQGRRVAEAPPRAFPAGRHAASLEVTRVPAGRYSLAIRTRGGERASRPWVVLH
jgi:hypothetical protein